MKSDSPLLAFGFPWRLLVVAAACSVALLLAAIFSLNRESVLGHELNEEWRTFRRLVHELNHLNTQLSDTARLAVYTETTAGAERYQRLELRAAERLAEAARLAPELYREIPPRHLTRLEKQALELARQGAATAAQRLLAGEEYQSQLRAYRAAWLRLENQLVQRETGAWEARRQQAFQSIFLLAAGVLGVVVFWWILFRYLRSFVALAADREQALRESEELNRTLLASLPQRVFYKDRRLVFRGVNAAFAADLGKTPEQVVGCDDFHFYPRELAEKYRADDLRVMMGRQPITLEERNIAQGKERIVEVVKAPVVDASGRVIGLVGLFTDISERKQAEAKLHEYARRLAQNNRELQEFAYVASHDLQEPLRKVRAFGDRLQAKCGPALTPECQDYLARMQNAAQRMQVLIEALLVYSRITTQAKPYEPVNLMVLVHEVLGDLEVRIEQTNARVTVGDLPVIHADPLQMRQLFQNLLGNALKFHRPGVQPEIEVKAAVFPVSEAAGRGVAAALLANRHPESLFCQIEVRDNGIGFDEKYAERIFGVFQRLHGRGEYEGAGVGLAICRKIVERHGGQIVAHGRPNQGATFLVTLPLAPVAEIRE